MMRTSISNRTAQVTLVLLVSLGAQTLAHAQGQRGPGGPPQSAEAAAPIDLTGYWTSLTTYDWNLRMVTPRPGDYENVPLNGAGIELMDAWDPAKDTAAGQQCKSYGAPTMMRNPEHLHITWQDEQTLKIEADAGEQTRLLHFGRSEADQGPSSLQGYSTAQWEITRASIGRGGGRNAAAGKVLGGDLKVMTSDLQAGYLRKNGIPYSDRTRMLEYYDRMPEIGGEQVVIVTSDVTDPVYLARPFVTNSIFKKLPSSTGWEPTPCSAVW
jgi:hypothetical protein